ncbi:MAG TPA: carbon-nitrogen hydrolase family protein [Bryobacterales bacterium]|nr:carbon-nitrogen hydrolase family protein [Bryobacterales bacterium]
MKPLCLALCLAAFAAAAPLHVEQAAFHAGADGVPPGWKTWAARPEIAPRTFVDGVHYRGRPGALAISGNSNAAEYGGWEYTVGTIEPGRWYRFVAYYRAEGLQNEPLQVVSRLDWTTAQGKRAGEPDYAYAVRPEGKWRRVTLDALAPEGAAAVKLQLFLQNAPSATVWWDDISLDQIPAPKPRTVTVAAVNLRPQNTGSAAESVRQFLEVVDKRVPRNADIILLPEGITVIGTGKKYADVAEPIPGPTTARLAAAARQRKAYIVAGIYEREGQAIYNTAVLIDRAGNLAGKYRKVYLPREEIEGGLTPGSDFPVFQADFGKVGMMICYDVFYADPARALALRGAELILMPIWGGNEALGKARAIENHVFVATSGYDYPTYVMDPVGEMLAVARDRGAVAVTTIDLNRRYDEKWLGNMRERFMKELRLDVKMERPGFTAP